MMSVAIILLIGLIMFVTVQLVVMRLLVERIKALETVTIMKVKKDNLLTVEQLFEQHGEDWGDTIVEEFSSGAVDFIDNNKYKSIVTLSKKQRDWLEDIYNQFNNIKASRSKKS